MHPTLQEYIQRFAKPQPTKNYDKFFTQLSTEEYFQKLPYFYDIENFCTRVHQAKINGEKVCIYSDYDTDAITATGVMYQGLLDLGFKKENLTTYAPDRFTEGYGINPQAIVELAQKNQLIISVDCGINSVEEAEIVKKTDGCDLIITDHHHLHGEVPDCVSVINPRLANYYQQTPFQKPFFELDTNDVELKNLIQNWQQKIYTSNSQDFLPDTVTGVGVAWFALVWYSYFCLDIGSN